MTILQLPIPAAAEIPDTREAQETRWIAWKAKAAANDRTTHRRMRIVFAAILIALACVTLAVVL